MIVYVYDLWKVTKSIMVRESRMVWATARYFYLCSGRLSCQVVNGHPDECKLPMRYSWSAWCSGKKEKTVNKHTAQYEGAFA